MDCSLVYPTRPDTGKLLYLLWSWTRATRETTDFNSPCKSRFSSPVLWTLSLRKRPARWSKFPSGWATKFCSSPTGGHILSVLPPHHVVLARLDQLLPDLPLAFELLESKYGPNYPSLMGFITGPSRTDDIERILVLGAYGPKKLTVIMV